MSKSELETEFLHWLRILAPELPEPAREYKFAKPRRWAFDLAWEDRRLALEIDGGTWSGGRHTRGGGFRNDCEKLNTAVLLGWRVLRFTGDMLHDDPHTVIAQVRTAALGLPWVVTKKNAGIKAMQPRKRRKAMKAEAA